MILRHHAPDSATLASYVLQDWKMRIALGRKYELDEIRSLLQDLRDCGPAQTSAVLFFNRLDSLNIGPVRVFVSGSCNARDLDGVIQTHLDETGSTPSWREHFESLNDALI